MTTNNYILARWRDAISDPPESTWRGQFRSLGGLFELPVRIRNGWILPMSPADAARKLQPGDQWLDVTDKEAVSKESFDSFRMQMAAYEYARGREFFAKQILSEIDSGRTIQEIAKTCLGEIRRCHRAEIDKEREKEGLPPVDWSKAP